MADRLAVKGQQDRCHIAMSTDDEVRYWTKHLRVTKEELQKAIDKVGNSAAAVRKELGASKADKAGTEKKNADKATINKPPHQ